MERILPVQENGKRKYTASGRISYFNNSNTHKELLMKTITPFSLKSRGQSFRYAYDGIISFFTTQHNAIIHFCFTVVVFIAALVFKISSNELIAVVMVVGFVWFAEIFNTAVEAMMDHISPQKHPAVKYIKDVSAAAVLVAAITAFIVGAIIFLPKIF